MPKKEAEVVEIIRYPNEYIERGGRREYSNPREVEVDVEYSADCLRKEVNLDIRVVDKDKPTQHTEFIEPTKHTLKLAEKLSKNIKRDPDSALDKLLVGVAQDLTPLEKKVIKKTLENDYNELKKQILGEAGVSVLRPDIKTANIELFEKRIAKVIERISTPDLSRVEPKFEHPQSTFIHEIREKMKTNLDNFKEIQNAKTAPNKEKVRINAPKKSIRESLSGLMTPINHEIKKSSLKFPEKETPDTVSLGSSFNSPQSTPIVKGFSGGGRSGRQ